MPNQWQYHTLPELSDEQYGRWRELLEQRTGMDFSWHKSIFQVGLSTRMREIGCRDYDDYYAQVMDLPNAAGEWIALVDRIAVNETSFYRQPQAYEFLRHYLGERLDGMAPGATLDLWSVGCATGEEAYSLAMIADEVLEARGADVFLGVVGMDISVRALAVARRGSYLRRRVDSLPATLRNRYFGDADGGLEVVPRLRQRVCFVQGNIIDLDRSPVVEMDVIYCQNVLVYFRRRRRHAVLDALAARLKPGGLLVVGPGEAAQWRNPGVTRLAHGSVQAYLRCGQRS